MLRSADGAELERVHPRQNMQSACIYMQMHTTRMTIRKHVNLISGPPLELGHLNSVRHKCLPARGCLPKFDRNILMYI